MNDSSMDELDMDLIQSMYLLVIVGYGSGIGPAATGSNAICTARYIASTTGGRTDMDYEKEQARLLRLFEEVTSGEECDDEEETGEEDNIEERPDDSDTEQEFNEDKAEEMDVRGPYFVGRDKRRTRV
ncbi:hypothetical protein QE152_g29880 [Popillia japonica]|uniref:Uncharacterized protein n=1 Tax=Popillia japonica TaxID=7064 RepID=A0AAW1JFT9_POPJA